MGRARQGASGVPCGQREIQGQAKGESGSEGSLGGRGISRGLRGKLRGPEAGMCVCVGGALRGGTSGSPGNEENMWGFSGGTEGCLNKAEGSLGN